MAHYKIQYLLIAGAIFLIGLIGAVFLVRNQTDNRSRAADATTLYFEPQSTSQTPIVKTIDTPLSLDVMVDPGNQLVSIVKLVISYDSTKLRPVVSSPMVLNTTAFADILQQPVVATNTIAATVSIGSNPTKAIQTITKVATVHFQPLSGTPEGSPTQIAFTTQTQVLSISEGANFNQNVLSGRSPAHVQIVGPNVTITPGPSISPGDGNVYTTSCTADLRVRDNDVKSNGTGKGTVLIERNGGKALVSVEYRRLSGNPNNIVIRGPVDGNRKGPSLFVLPKSQFSNYVVPLTPSQLNQLKNNRYVIDVQTRRYDKGEIWGRINNCKAIPPVTTGPTQGPSITGGPTVTVSPPISPEPSPITDLPTYPLTCTADLKDRKDNQPNNKRAVGKSTIVVSADRTKALITLSYKRLGDKPRSVGIFGPPAQNGLGPKVFTLPNGQFSNHEVAITASQIQTLVDGQYTFNATTREEPNSALRGKYGNCDQTPNPEGSALALNLFLHGIGNGGDNANPNGGGNKNPITPTRLAQLELYDTSNTLVAEPEGNVTYDPASGSYKGSIVLGNDFKQGDYTIKVKVNKYLQKTAPNLYRIRTGILTAVPPLRLTVGDIVGDNKLNILDFNALTGCVSGIAPPSSCQGEIVAQSADTDIDVLVDESDLNAAAAQQFNQNEAADINDDGVVNELDLNLFLRELTAQPGS